MESEKENEQQALSPEETQRLKQYLEYQTERLEVVGLLDKNSASFADWSIIISEAVHAVMAKKQQSNEDCVKERVMLEKLTFLFTKLAFHNRMLSEWHKELSFRIENSEKMLE
jgi:glycine cleavage system pyridoxal-binding protein P